MQHYKKLQNTKAILIAFLLIIAIINTGCGSKIISFAESPENTMKVSAIDDSIKNADENHKFYESYRQYKMLGIVSDDFKKFITNKTNGKSDIDAQKIAGEYANNGDLLYMCYLAYLKEDKGSEIDKQFAEIIQNYIKYTRMGQGEMEFVLHPDFDSQNPVAKVKEYMTKNKIVITDVQFPKNIVSKDITNYPLKFTYTYVLKGTVNGKKFEKEVTQDFYIGAQQDNGHYKDVLYGVYDVNSNPPSNK